MDDVVERMRLLVAQDEADMEHSRSPRPRHSWLRWLCQAFTSADRQPNHPRQNGRRASSSARRSPFASPSTEGEATLAVPARSRACQPLALA